MTAEGGFDLSGLLQQAQAMQQQLAEAQQAQAATSITGMAGGGKVTVEATGDGQFRRVTIAPDLVNPDDVEMLEELILVALRDVSSQIADLQSGAVGGIQLPDLGGLGRLFGGS